MKKFAKVIEMIGTVVFLFCICIDATEYPVTAIPVLIGLLLIYIGTKRWGVAGVYRRDCRLRLQK